MLITQGKTNWKYILIVVILAVIVGGGIFWLSFIKTEQSEKTEDKIIDWKIYTNEEYAFDFQYPKIYDRADDQSCKIEELAKSSIDYFNSESKLKILKYFTIGRNISLLILDSNELELEEYKEKYLKSNCVFGEENTEEICDLKIESEENIKVGEKEALKISHRMKFPIIFSDEKDYNLIDPKVQIIITIVANNSPAEEAGLRRGDIIKKLKFQNQELEITKVKEVQEFSSIHKGEEIILTIQRGDEIFETSIVPRFLPLEGEGLMGIALIRAVLIDHNEITTFLIKDNNVFVFNFNNSDINKFNCEVPISEVDVYNQMLSTFRFLELPEKVTQNETADWQFYRNEEYGFEVKYPLGKSSFEVVNKNRGYFDFTTFKVITIDTSLDQKSNLPTGNPTGRITIYADRDPVWLESCLESKVISKTIPDKVEEINGVEFYVFDESSVAMGGQRGDEKSYRTLQNNTCYRIQTLVLWRSITFYHDATDLKSATEEELQEQNKLIKNQTNFNNQMLSTFQIYRIK